VVYATYSDIARISKRGANTKAIAQNAVQTAK
jgi:hypothetical protein